MLNRMKIYDFRITRASEASERKFFGVFLRKNESTYGKIEGKQGHTQTASERSERWEKFQSNV